MQRARARGERSADAVTPRPKTGLLAFFCSPLICAAGCGSEPGRWWIGCARGRGSIGRSGCDRRALVWRARRAQEDEEQGGGALPFDRGADDRSVRTSLQQMAHSSSDSSRPFVALASSPATRAWPQASATERAVAMVLVSFFGVEGEGEGGEEEGVGLGLARWLKRHEAPTTTWRATHNNSTSIRPFVASEGTLVPLWLLLLHTRQRNTPPPPPNTTTTTATINRPIKQPKRQPCRPH